MLIDLAEFVEEPGGRWKFPLDFMPAPADDLRFTQPVRGNLTVHHVGGELVFSGAVEAVFEVECVRCLNRFELQVAPELESVLPVPVAQAVLSGKAIEMEADLAAAFTERGVDVDELIRQAAVLAMPMQAVCSPDCRGLCARCGRDRNQGDCGCQAEETDPRLSALAAWRRE